MSMYDPKPAASLTGGLLVRKGQARPALSPGLVLEADDAHAAPRRVITLPRPEAARPMDAEAMRQVVPPVDKAKSEAKPKAEGRPEARRRVAFTYRLDPERHLNLRVVAIYKRTSAQKILDEALDRYLDEVMAEEGSLVFPKQLSAAQSA